MAAFCRDEFSGSDHNDHVWRWRNEQAGYSAFARRPWKEALRNSRVYFDITSLDPHKQARHERYDDNREGWRNGDGPIY